MRASLRNCSNPLEIYKEREKEMKMKLVERFANEIFGASSAKGSIEGADISVLKKSMGIQFF